MKPSRVEEVEYKVGQCLIPLTVELVRSKYALRGTEMFKKIEHFSPQSDADRLRIQEVHMKDSHVVLKVVEEFNKHEYVDDAGEPYPPEIFTIEPEYFTPNGNLIEGIHWGEQKTHEKWLQKGAPGPYEVGQTMPFFYLEGKVGKEKRGTIQVAAGPINTLSYDALDAITLWVHE
jgi:hypothetical protein